VIYLRGWIGASRGKRVLRVMCLRVPVTERFRRAVGGADSADAV
jgi:hypothetical protein